MTDRQILVAARDRLAEQLAAWAAAHGQPAPEVTVLGGTDLLRPEPAEAARQRAGATVHLGSQAVLIGPWGGPPGTPDAPAACGSCLAMRWQRLRSRTEREALEAGSSLTAVDADWPVLTEHAVDAVWALLRAVSARTGGPLAQVSRLDLETLRVQSVPLLAEPLCPSCTSTGTPSVGEGPVLPLVSRPKPGPDDYRLRPASSYALPADALANPVCGVLGAGTWSDVTSPTTAPVAGSVFMRGYAGLTDVTWSGQANTFATSRDLAFLEGLERYAGTHRRRTAPLLTDSYRNLAGGALDPATAASTPSGPTNSTR